MKAALLIAFHLPPSTASSGHLRPLGFAKYLPASGWLPVILSASERAYPFSDAASVSLIPESSLVYRAFALDVKRHLGVRGKYPSILAQPDRWASWWPGAVYRGLRLIRRYKVQAIWSTYPIMTAHCVAYTLSRLTGLPWIADFRDPVANSVATQNSRTIATQMRWERRVLARAAFSVFTTPGAMRSYADRYPQAHSDERLQVIPNGFDEDDFLSLPPYTRPEGERPLHLVHSGILYPSGRNPLPFLRALARLRDSGFLAVHKVKVTLRASGSEAPYGAELEHLGLTKIVTLAPPVPYHEALAEQARADALLLFQGDQYDNQIPAKLYEYLRIGRPIFALVGEHGDTAAELLKAGGAEVVPIDDISRIEEGLKRLVHSLVSEQNLAHGRIDVARWSRRQGASELARLLDRASDQAFQGSTDP